MNHLCTVATMRDCEQRETEICPPCMYSYNSTGSTHREGKREGEDEELYTLSTV